MEDRVATSSAISHSLTTASGLYGPLVKGMVSGASHLGFNPGSMSS